MRIYVPLSKKGSRLYALNEGVDIREWRDKNYLEFFESELSDSHAETRQRVVIAGAEFPDCRVFLPTSEALHDAFVVTDEDFVPEGLNSRRDEDTDRDLPATEWVHRWVANTKHSENFYHNYVVDLSTKYISPQVLWDDDTYTNVNHPNAMRKGSRVLLVGQPGAGKTSFARYLTQVYLSESQNKAKRAETPLVFYFQLRDFSHKAHEFGSWLSSEEDEVGRQFALRRATTGRALCVFDGLDELNEADRGLFSDWLSRFVESRPSTSTIVTSRELGTLNSGIWRTFRKAKVLPFDNRRIREYCELVIEDRERSNRFVSVLNSNPDLQEFLKNPFSLSLAIGMYMLRGSLPFNIGVLCRELVAQLVERWDTRRGIKRVSELSAESVNSTLGRLAYRLQANRDAQFAPELLEDLLPYDLDGYGARAVLQDLSERTGLISEVGPDLWSFGHRYLQDFFCANHMVERASGLGGELAKHGSDARWVDVWRQVGQLCQDPEFFALEQSRAVSGGIKSIDRMVSSLLSHEGLSRGELQSIVFGIVDEFERESSNLPDFAVTDYGFELDCSGLDDNSTLILAKIVTHLSYLKSSNAGITLLEAIDNGSASGFAEVVRDLLMHPSGAVPIVRVSTLQIHFKRISSTDNS